MLRYSIHLDRHDIHEDAPGHRECHAAFATYSDAERYAKELAAEWLDRQEPVVVIISDCTVAGDIRYFPLRTTTDDYGSFHPANQKLKG